MQLLITRRALFWDVAESEIPQLLLHSPEWVIPWVFEYGTLADIDDVIQYYGHDKVSLILSNTAMRLVTRAMAFFFLGINPTGYYVS